MQPLNRSIFAMSSPLLQIRGVSKSFHGVKALDDISLALRAGEVHALMGENGAGKSTLIKVLTGVHPADHGSIFFEGHPIAPRSPRDAEAQGISTVYQEINLIPTLSVADNILLGRQPTRFGLLRKKIIRKRAEEAVGRLGLTLNVSRLLGACSIAEQQLVAIARALDVNARLLILDEPTSSLDEREVKFLFGILRDLRARGMALLFVTHFLDQVYAISDRITVLRNGRFVGEYSTAELPRLKLIGAMLGREYEEMQQLSEEKPSESGQPQTGNFLEGRTLSRRGSVQSFDLDIRPGEVLGLAGLLGSGRTETARMLFGVDPPESGEIRILNQSVRIDSPRRAVKHGLAFCAEDRKTEGIVPHLSVRENLILAMQANRGALRLLSRQEQETLANHYIQTLNIKAANIEMPIMNLSGGNQQKVLLARWLAMQPKLIILDEPTRGIDVGAKAEIEKLVHTLRARGMSVLFISSDIEEMARTCERVVVLRDRRKAGELEGPKIGSDDIMRVIAHRDE
jgi:galactofuranose transport system ATP-binding protein